MYNKFEQLALWYLRLNGYLTVPNFILHPDTPGSERTDADILAVKFPYSSEVAGRTMERDSKLVHQDGKIDFIIAEVKGGRCRLNGPWRNKKLENMHYVLRWFGIAPSSEVPQLAKDLYQNFVCERKQWSIRLVCFGKQQSPYLPETVLQLTHEHVIEFVSNRFRMHADTKASHRQWDSFIKKFYAKTVTNNESVEQILSWLTGPTDY